MNKQQAIIQFIEKQLKKMHEAHVDVLMKARRSEELKDLIKKLNLDFSALKKLTDYDFIYSEKDEIPKEYLYELALYIQQSKRDNFLFFLDFEDYQELLREENEEVATGIADLLDRYDIYKSTIDELLFGKK